jgi:hypothetical protein
LRRATSATYYALFHCLARETANLFIGANAQSQKQPAWQRVYRAHQHKAAKDQCKKCSGNEAYPAELRAFATHFVSMQTKRHEADYNPHATFAKSAVMADILAAEAAIKGFRTVREGDRRAFCANILFRDPQS